MDSIEFIRVYRRFVIRNHIQMRIINFLLVSCLCIASLYAQQNMPSVEVQNIDGDNINIGEYTKDGKTKIISLWATWCGPCRTELKALHQVYPTWKEKYDIEIVAITVDRGRMLDRAKDMFKVNGWDYTFFHDNNDELMSAFNITGIPFSILVDGEGNIKSTQTGYFPGYEKELESKLKAL